MSTHTRASLAGALLLILVTASSLTRAQAGGPVNLNALNAAYTQNFDTLASSGTGQTALPTGWAFAEGGSNANTTYSTGTGSGNAGDTYSFGAAASTERAFGGLQSGTLIPTIGAAFLNSTGQTITSLDVAYDGEQWRLGTQSRVDRLDFQYSVDATSLATGTWTDVNALDFTTPNTTAPIGALDGEANQVSVSGLISGLSVAPNSTFWIRWTDFNATGADDGLAVDDFSLTPHGGNQPTLSINNPSVTEGNAGPMTASFTVSVSSGAHAGVTFDIATADGTGPSAATTADNDYVARSLTVQIPAGQTTAAFDVTINGDTAVEPDETFFARITNAAGAVVGDDEGLATIVNDDAPPPVTTDVAISQIYGGGGNAGTTLTNDYIELFNRGTTTISLGGWSVQYSSAAGTGTWAVTPLTGSIGPGGYYLVQEAQGTGGTTPLPSPDASGSIAMAAAAGKVALQVTTTPIVGQCPSAGTADLVGYGTTATCFEGGGTAPAPSNTTSIFRKRGGCFDSDNNNIDFAAGSPAPRNSATAPRSCIPISTAIHNIQGTGLTSPFAGLDVLTSGIVTGVKSNGFFLQAPDNGADSDQATSEGIFVFTSATPAVVPGNETSARGTVSEFFDLTQIEATLPGDVTVWTPSNPLPTPVLLTPALLDPNGGPSQLEPFEAMRVFGASLTTVAPTDGFGEIATVLTGVPRPIREPGISIKEVVPPDPTSGVVDCCIPRFDENPERIFIDSEGLVGTSVLTVTSNVVLSNVVGPLDFSFGNYKILPEVPPGTSANMTGLPVPTPNADEFTVAGFNIENFNGNTTQRIKAALAIRQLMKSPDVIGHIEILDLATLQGLADQVNADAVAAAEPNPGYQALLIQAPLGGTQNVGFLVKTSKVRIDSVSQERANDTYLNPVSGQQEPLHDRPPLVLRATVDALGLNPRPVIVVVNHLRSFIDIELVGGDGPRVRAKRKAQAEATAQLLQDLQSQNPGVAVISMGDYNAYHFNDGYTDPIATLKGTPTPDDQLVVDGSPDLVDPNFVNLTDSLPVSERYSFIFEGTPQVLDHALLNTVALSYVQRYAIARGNSDFPSSSALAADTTRPERSSDHDMPVAYFRFPPPTTDLRVTMTAGSPSVVVGGQIVYTIIVTNGGPAPAQHVVVSDALPAGVAFVSCTATAGVCGGSGSSRTVTIDLLQSGASETVTITASANCNVPDGTTIANIVSVGATTGDSDSSNNTATANVSSVNATPAITGTTATPTQLWPANKKLVPVTIGYAAADACGPVTTALSVTSNEPIAPSDFQILNAHDLLLRADRSPQGDGRIYTVTITATDAAGGASTATVGVIVPRHGNDR